MTQSKFQSLQRNFRFYIEINDKGLSMEESEQFLKVFNSSRN